MKGGRTRPALEVEDIFRSHDPSWREAKAGHISIDRMKVEGSVQLPVTFSSRKWALRGCLPRAVNPAFSRTEPLRGHFPPQIDASHLSACSFSAKLASSRISP
jgi:hypothetical protein